jgi:hypothetical protein
MILRAMKINTQQKTVPIKRTRVNISPNPIRTREVIDSMGNIIDMRTKEIIKKNTD